MPLINEHGRVFGRWNMIDAAVAAAGVLLVVLGAGAFLLFRTPVPTIASVEPTQLREEQTATLRIVGEDIRPFLRARLGEVNLGAVLAESPTAAEVKVPAGLKPGTYDLILLDEARELVRKPRAVTVAATPVTPPPPVPKTVRPEIEVQIVGAFVYLTDEDARLIKPGLKLDRRVPPTAQAEMLGSVQVATVLAVRRPEVVSQRFLIGALETVQSSTPGKLQVPAIINLRCVTVNRQCRIGDTVVTPEYTIPLQIPPPPAEAAVRPPTPLIFLPIEFRPTGAPLVFPPPAAPSAAFMEMQAVGEFVYLTEAEAKRIRAGAQFEEPPRPSPHTAIDARPVPVAAEVLVARPAEPATQRVRVSQSTLVATPVPNALQVPAITRLRCEVVGDQCRIGPSGIVQQGELIRLHVPAGPAERLARQSTLVIFRIAILRPVDAPLTFPDTVDATVRVRFFVRPEILDLVKAGDLDIGEPGGRRAALTAVALERERVAAKTTISGFEIEQNVTAFQATVKVPGVTTPEGLLYKGKSVKLGAPFVFEAPNYVMEGWIQSVQAPADGPGR